MTQIAPSQLMAVFDHARLPSIDLGYALDLLTRAVNEGGEARWIVGHALLLANVSVDDLNSMRGQLLRDLYREGRLPVVLTLGALIVFDAAQRSQDRGRRSTDVLDDATDAAARFLDLVAVLPEASEQLRHCGKRGRCILRRRDGSPL